ncbi:Ig-like domain-containing protein [Streptomyces erythrochromogenes]|uniref:L,D-transpeptidase n=1 Tax=Streptomyces erythrochromogenes TaxID=285574 RepID=UPI003423829C
MNFRFRPTVLAATMAAAAVALTATAHAAPADSPAPPASQGSTAASRDASTAEIAITPGHDAEGIGITKGVDVTVSGGKLTAVEMHSLPTGTETMGTMSPDGTSWKPDTALARGTKYSITATAKDAHGRTATEKSSFTTVAPEKSFIGYFTPEDGETVGVGMPVSINFDKPITDRKAVQSAIHVTSTGDQPIAGHWFSPTRLDFRPQDYWKPDSDVTVKLELDGVQGGDGITGVQNKTFGFHIGRSQVSTVDAKTKTMTVVRDGKTLKTIPVSTGSAENPTYNGQMVISEKHDEMRMDGSTVGFTDEDGKAEYDIPDVPHAMRLSASGTFLHGNYWAAKDVFGKTNTSHGCIGLSDLKGGKDPSTPAAWFYANSLVGDVVIVKHSDDETIRPDNGLSDWNMPWSTWTEGSAA